MMSFVIFIQKLDYVHGEVEKDFINSLNCIIHPVIILAKDQLATYET